VAAKDDKKDSNDSPSAKPRFDPKPVQLGGESLIERLIPHMKKIVIFVVGVALILTIVFTFRYFQERGRQKSSEKLAKVLEVADREVRPAGQEPDPKAKEPTFGSSKERAEAILDALAKQGTDAGGPAYRASMLMESGKVDEAIIEYKKGQTAKGLDGVLAREGLGIAIESKAEAEKDATARQKGLEEALGVFQQMQPDEKGPRYAYALYHQGRILGLLGRNAEAKTTLEKAKELGKDGELPGLIEERLAMLGGS
jgi:predicted negative regulator of RcsB-dependent stress response